MGEKLSESTAVQKSMIAETFPLKSHLLKRVQGNILRVFMRLDPEAMDIAKTLVLEVWTDIVGNRFHGHDLKRLSGTNVYYKDFELKHTGFFKMAFRWRRKEAKFWNWVDSENPNTFSEIHVDPEYIEKSVVYNAFIRFFGHAKLTKKGVIKYGDSGTFDDLKVKLKELKNMGISIIYLNPIHVIGDLYRNYNPHDQFPKYLQPGCPYSIKDYKSIDPELAIDRDHNQGPYSSLSDPMIEFRELIKAAHKLGMKIYMDLVFNHTSHDFVLQRLHPEWFLYKTNIKSLTAHYIHPDEIQEGKPWGDPAHTMCPYDHGFWWEDAAQLNWEYMLPEAPNKPPSNPTIHDMYEYFKSIPKYWIKHFGVDGFRCDVAYRVPPKFWKECITEAREFAKREHPKNGSVTGDVVFIAESYVDDLVPLYKAGFTAVYGDFSNKLYTPLSLKGYLDYMYNISGKFFPDGAKFFIFPECHDFVRNTRKLLGHVSNDAVLSERANRSRWVLTMALPGIPMIFNGYEKLEWQPVNLFSYSSIDWESDRDLKEFIIKANAIRNKYKALQSGTYTYIDNSQGLNQATQIFCFARKYDKELFIICVNMDIHHASHATLHLPASLGISRRYALDDVLNGKKYVREGPELQVILEAGRSHVFHVINK